MTTKIQLRGNCQCCGSLQAVTNGFVAKHGYTVKDGWFQGVCSGHMYPSMQTHRDTTDRIIAEVLADVEKLKQTVIDLKSGKIFPLRVEVGSRRYLGNGQWSDNTVPYADAPEYEQRRAVEAAIYNTESRIRSGQNFASNIGGLVNRVNGTPLLEFKKPEAAARIQAGERRVSESGSVLTAKYQEAARVYWSRSSADGRVASGWMGSRSWRNLGLAE